MGLPARAFQDLTIAVSLDPTNKEIQHELEKVVLLCQSTIKGKRKFDSFDSLEGTTVGALSGERDLDSRWVATGSEKLEATKMPLPSSSASIVHEDLPSADVTSVLYQGSIAPDAHVNRATAPSSGLMNGCPFKVDNLIGEVSTTSSDVVLEDEFRSSSNASTLVEPMYRFMNQQRHDSNIKIPQSFYQALLHGKVISYSSHSQFLSLTIHLQHPHNFRDKLQVDTTTSTAIPDLSVCFQRQPLFDLDTSKVAEENVSMSMDYTSLPSPPAFQLSKAPRDGPLPLHSPCRA